MTNFELIKSMTQNELATWLAYVRANVLITGNRSISQPAVNKNLEWLNKTVEEEQTIEGVYWEDILYNTSYKIYRCSNCGTTSPFKFDKCYMCGKEMINGEIGAIKHE